MTEPDGAPNVEHILCDTTVVSILDTARRKPARIEHWPQEIIARLQQAILAISVISFAELRAGHVAAEYPEATVARKMETIAAYLLVPIDMKVVERWALRDPQRKRGKWGIDDNDLWIIATAETRGWPVVTCDARWRNVPELDLIYLPSVRDSPPV